jgi:hypothetical protein
MPFPSSVNQIEQKMKDLASTFSAICARVEMTNATHEGRKVAHLRIGTGTGEGRPRILIVSGVHAREFAPPDAVLTFVEKLMDAYTRSAPMVYNQFIDARGTPTVTYKRFTIPFPDVKRIIERTELYVLPLANPDGRRFAMSSVANNFWRKNRRPAPVGVSCAPSPDTNAVGVDINRNFDIAWDFEKYYSNAAITAMRAAGQLSVSTDPCDVQSFHGPAASPPPVPPPGGPGSEPETRNIQELITTKKISFYMDVHSFAGNLLFPWGIAPNQTTDTAKTFRNPALDQNGGIGGRFPLGAVPAYAEWLPPGSESRHRTLGESMRDAILNSTGYTAVDALTDPVADKARKDSLYPAVQSLFLFGTGAPDFTTGGSDDFAFSQQIGTALGGPPVKATALDEVFSFTFECGRATDGGFHPNATTAYPKVEREVGMGLAAYLKFAATWHAPVPPPSGGPAPTPPPPPKSGKCFIATASYGSPLHPQVQFLRDLRDREIRATGLGRRVARVVDRVYYSFSPQVAGVLERRPVLRGWVRVGVLAPTIGFLRGCARLVSGIEPAERRVRWLLWVIAAGGVASASALGAALYALCRSWAGF